MSNFDENEHFIRQFIVETEEHIDVIEEKLLEFEKNLKSKNPLNEESINELFRAIHTIKGLSGMLEFTNLFKFTHIWENILDKVRKKKLEISEEIIDIFFDSLDLLTKTLSEIKDNKSDNNIDPTENISKLDNILNKDNKSKSKSDKKNNKKSDELLNKISEVITSTLEEFELKKLKKFIKDKQNIFQIKLLLNKNCFDKDISYMSTCINIEFIGEIINITTNINNIEEIKHFDPENFDLEIYILLSTNKDIEDVYKVLKNEEIEVELIDFSKEKPDKNNIQSNENTPKNEIITSKEKIQVNSNNQISSDKDEQNNITNKYSSQDTIRVETQKLDSLLALLGEQVISKTQLEHLSNELIKLLNNKDELNINTQKLSDISENFNETINSFSRLSNELQEIVMRIRMLPIGSVFNRFHRVVRDLSKELGKQVNLQVTGEETELDKTIIEEISDPMIHIIRNAIDHGLEEEEERKNLGKSPVGLLKFDAYQQGNSIIITIQDDGKGLNLNKIKETAIKKGIISNNVQLTDSEIINLIFTPGFSTANEVTTTSGRGVGMDVVSKNISKLKGTIDVETQEGSGTKFIIKLPLTLAIIQALIVEVGKFTFAIPLSSVIESYRARPEEIKLVNNKPVLKLRDKILPVLSFKDYFKIEEVNNIEKKYYYIVVIGLAENKVGFIVDKLIGQQEIVIKPLTDPLVSINGIAGATLLGKGVTLIIDTIPIILSNQKEKQSKVTKVEHLKL